MVDTANKFFVGARGDGVIVIINHDKLAGGLTPNDAVTLAAWLVSLAEPFASVTFDEVTAAMREEDNV